VLVSLLLARTSCLFLVLFFSVSFLLLFNLSLSRLLFFSFSFPFLSLFSSFSDNADCYLFSKELCFVNTSNAVSISHPVSLNTSAHRASLSLSFSLSLFPPSLSFFSLPSLFYLSLFLSLFLSLSTRAHTGHLLLRLYLLLLFTTA